MTQHEALPEGEQNGGKPKMNKPVLSHRAREAAEKGNPFAEGLLGKILGDQYSPEHPDGLVNLGVAENSLMADWLLEHFKTLDLTYTDLTYGDAIAGSKRLQAALIKLFQNYFNPLRPVKSNQLQIGAGVSAVLDQLGEKLCDIGDVILIARPYYNGFDNDFTARDLIDLQGVDLSEHADDMSSPKTLQAFEKHIQILKAQGKTARAVILCNPNNPLGFCYPKETILEYCRFAERHNLHLIVDEIYALSLYKNKSYQKQTPFLSILSIDVEKEAQCNPARIHMLYGMSKDFGANGLRIGVLVSQHNPELMGSFMASAILMKVASPADALWSSILNDDKVLTEYLDKAQSKASDTVQFTIEWLERMKIGHSNPVAGHFIWIDLRSFLPKRDRKGKTLKSGEEQEIDLFMRLLEDAKIYVAAGRFYHSTTPGFFRLTFTVRRDYLTVGLERLERVLNAVKLENLELVE